MRAELDIAAKELQIFTPVILLLHGYYITFNCQFQFDSRQRLGAHGWQKWERAKCYSRQARKLFDESHFGTVVLSRI